MYLLITFFMKKLLFSLIAMLIMSTPAMAQAKNGWTGNENVNSLTRLQDSEFAIVPRAIDPTLNGVMTKIKFYRQPYEEYNTNSYAIRIYENINLQLVDPTQGLYDISSCGDMVYEQPFICDGTGWQEIELDTPYQLPEGDFWVSIKMNGMGTLVFGGENEAVEGQYFYMDMINYTNYWRHTYFIASSYNEVLYSCGMCVYTEDAPQSCEAPSNLYGEYIWIESGLGVNLTWDNPQAASIDHINIFRGESLENMQQITEVSGENSTYFDVMTDEPGEYYYQITAVYENGCVSDYASALDNPENNYICVFITGVGEETSLDYNVYPNPTIGMLIVEADLLQNIEVFDNIGRIILRKENCSEKENVDLSGFPKGVYTIKLITENGVGTKKVVVK